MSIGFNWFKKYEIIHDRLDYCYDNYRIIYNGGNSTSHSAGNIIKVQNLIEKYSGKRIPHVNEYDIDSIDYKIDLIEPTEMIEICNKILANTECDEVGMRNRIERFKELSEDGYYLSYDCD